MDLEIKIKQGLGNIKFGMTMAETQNILGQPTDTEVIDDGMGQDITVAHYDNDDISLFFEGAESLLNCFDISNPEVTLFGEKIFQKNEREIVSLLVANHLYEQDIENEAWGERRVTFADANIDLFFADNKLQSVSLGR